MRCCSIDGATCQSQDFDGGVDYDTPNGGVHTQCYFDVTYHEAMTKMKETAKAYLDSSQWGRFVTT